MLAIGEPLGRDRALVASLAAIGAAVALVALLAAPWYRARYGATAGGRPAEVEASAYQALSGADLLIVLLAGAAALSAHLAGLGRGRFGRVAALAALGALSLVALKLPDSPAPDPGFGGSFTLAVSLLWGAWASLGAALVISVAGLLLVGGKVDRG